MAYSRGATANPRGPPGTGPLGTPSMTPYEPSPDRESVIGGAPTLVPGPLARLQDLQLLTELSQAIGFNSSPSCRRLFGPLFTIVNIY
jgi:hypothetical protein